MCSYLVYPTFPLIGMVGAVCDSSDQFSGSIGSKSQMFAFHDAVRATVPVTWLVTTYSCRLLGIPGFALQYQRLLGPAPKEIACLGSFCLGCCLGPALG